MERNAVIRPGGERRACARRGKVQRLLNQEGWSSKACEVGDSVIPADEHRWRAAVEERGALVLSFQGGSSGVHEGRVKPVTAAGVT